MLNTTSTIGDDSDHRLHETIMLSTNQIVASIEASSASTEALLCKVVESQAHSQQQMMELLRMLVANNNATSINSAGICNEAAGKKSSSMISANLKPDNLIVDDRLQVDRVVEIESFDNNNTSINAGFYNELAAGKNSTAGDDIEEADEIVRNAQQEEDGVVQDYYNFDGYEPLIEAISEKDWIKAKEYLNDHKTDIKGIFETRDSEREINFLLDKALYRQEWVFLEEIVKLAPPKALEFIVPLSHEEEDFGMTILHMAASIGILRVVKVLVEKNSKLPQIRSLNEINIVPLLASALNHSEAQKEVLEYLYPLTSDDDPSPFSGLVGAMLLKSLIEAEAYGIALSISLRFPELLQEDLIVEDGACMPLLRRIVERPYSFLDETKLPWWERCIGSLFEPSIDSPQDDSVATDNPKVAESSEGTKEDEENPPDTSIREDSSTSENRTITKYISLYFMHYMRQVPPFKRIYDQKLVNLQVTSLAIYLLAQLKATVEATKIKDLFRKSELLDMAIKFGTTDFVVSCLLVFPYLCFDDVDGDVGQKLIKLVAEERNEVLYNAICMVQRRHQRGRLSMLDEKGNSILHFSAKLAPNRRLNSISGAAFQMQRELQWFKGVENTMLQKERFHRNNDGDTAQFVFTEKHKGLVEKGEKWMKETSGSCMVVAALIATVAFAAAFTVPGGNISDSSSIKNGFPVFQGKKSFMVFAVADALALFSSITSVLMFLAVFTSRYSEEDFLKSLPQKLIIGLASLFISMATILVSFGAAYTIVLGEKPVWGLISIAVLGCAPVLLFGFLQFPLFFQMVKSTYWPTILGKDDKKLLELFPLFY